MNGPMWRGTERNRIDDLFYYSLPIILNNKHLHNHLVAHIRQRILSSFFTTLSFATTIWHPTQNYNCFARTS